MYSRMKYPTFFASCFLFFVSQDRRLATLRAMVRLSSRARRWVLVATLAALVAAAFSAALPGAFIWDDRTLIEQNSQITSLGNIGQVFTRHFLDSDRGTLEVANLYYRPLVTLSFMVDHAVFGMEPWGFHLTNLLLHLFATLLVFALARRVLRRPGGDDEASWQADVAPWAVAALFAVHPSRVEAVSWVSGRTDVMMTICVVASLLAFWRALVSEDRRRLMAGAAWAAYVCALLCKETAVAMAVAVPALDWALISRGERKRFWANARWTHLPLVISTAAFVAFRLWFQGRVLGTPSHAALDLGGRALLLFETLGHYVHLTLMPYSPNMQVGAYWTPQTASWGLVATGGVALLAYAAALAWALKRGPGVPAFALLLGGAFFLPAANLVPLSVHAMAADRFLYVPLLGAALLAGVGLTRIMARSRVRGLVLLLVGLVSLSWAAMVNLRSRDFAGPVRFWVAELAASPDNPLVQEKLGSAMMERRRYREAEKWYDRSLRSLIRRGQPPARVMERLLKVLDSHTLHTSDHDTSALGGVLRLLAKLEALGARQPGRDGGLRLALHDQVLALDLAAPDMHAALKKELPVLQSMQGNILSRLGHDDRALAIMTRAVTGRPRSLAFRMNLALMRLRALDPAGARAALAHVQKARPGQARVASLARLIQASEVKIKQLRALGYRPGAASSDPRVHWLLAELHQSSGARQRACQHLRRIIKLTPGQARAWALLINELAAGGDAPGALRVLIQAKKRFGAVPGLLRLEQKIKRSAVGEQRSPTPSPRQRRAPITESR